MCIEVDRFVGGLNQELVCPICLGALCIDSVTDEEEHTYCKLCILKWLNEHHKCPLGKETIDTRNLKPLPRIIKNILSEYEIYCKYKDRGCKVTPTYTNILQHELNCLFNPQNNPNNIKTVYKEFKTEPNKINSSIVVEFPAINMWRMILSKDKTRLYITDETQSVIHISDLNGNLIQTINPNGLLKQPIGMCINNYIENEEEILVGDYVDHQIFVFNSNFNLKRKFTDSHLNIPQCLFCDTHSNNGILYITDMASNNITTFNIETGAFIDIINIERPFGIKFTQDKLFVTSPTDFTLDRHVTNKVIKYNAGENCIFILNKLTFQLINKIEPNYWLNPQLIHIDESCLNMYIAAYEIDSENIKSNYKYLVKTDINGNLIKKFLIDGLQALSDTIMFEKNLIICCSTYLRLIKYE